MKNKDWKLTHEEQALLDSFRKGEWISSNEDLNKYKQAARNTPIITEQI